MKESWFMGLWVFHTACDNQVNFYKGINILSCLFTHGLSICFELQKWKAFITLRVHKKTSLREYVHWSHLPFPCSCSGRSCCNCCIRRRRRSQRKVITYQTTKQNVFCVLHSVATSLHNCWLYIK